MSALRTVSEVAKWEFRRFFKPKEQLVTLLLFVMTGLLFYGIGKLREKSEGRPVRIAVAGDAGLHLVAPTGSRLQITHFPSASADSLRVAVGSKALDALLLLEGTEKVRLVVAREPRWKPEIEALLGDARRVAGLRSLGLDAATLDSLLAAPRVLVELHEAASRTGSRASMVTAIIFLVITLIGVYLGNAYLFLGITGEKQQRVTEQILSAISPQSWIDGKILGLAGVAMVSLLTMGLGFILFSVIPGLFDLAIDPAAVTARALEASSGIALPDPGFVVVAAAFSVLGFLFWFTFFAAVAATINDPNTSNRTGMLFLPMMPAAFTFIGLIEPESALFRIWSLLPISAHAAMPVRMALTDVPVWETVLAALGTAISALLLRRAAGKIFALGTLLYGKEPKWKEIARWIREA